MLVSGFTSRGAAATATEIDQMRNLSKHMLALLLAFAVSLPSALASGHAESDAQADLSAARAAMRESREAIIGDELRLTAAEEQEFRAVYDSYRSETNALFDRKADLIVEYVARYKAADIDDRYANSLVDDYLRAEKELLDTRRKYVKRFRKVLPAKKVARLFQLENKIDAEIDAELAAAIPLIDPQ